MARIIRKSNALIQEYRKNERRSIAFLLLPLLCVGVIALYANRLDISALLPVILFVAPVTCVCFVFAAIFGREARVLAAGIEGERVTAEIISSLPKGYYGFQNVNVTYDGKTSELDMVVVGPTGIFVIETKNLNGTIVGNYEAAKWTQEKIGRGGTPYDNVFYSPVKQVGTHVYRLAKYLKQNGIRKHIYAMVYFSNPEAEVRIMGNSEHIPVFSSRDKGIRRIRNYITENESHLSVTEIQRVHRLLNKERNDHGSIS